LSWAEEHLAARRVRMRASLESGALERAASLARLRTPAAALGRDEETADACHAPSVPAPPDRVARDMWVLIVLLAIILVVFLLLVALYNRLVRYRNRVDNAWAQVEVQLKRRWDLIPNLVETVKGYAAHERGVFEEVTAARTRAQQAQSPAESAQAEGILSQALGRLFAVAEAYPDPKATQNFQA